MEATAGPLSLPNPPQQPNLDKIKQNLLNKGIEPTPKIIHTLRKKELQKINRRLAKQRSKQPQPLTDAQKRTIAEETHLQIIKSEYKKFTKSVDQSVKLVGRPWEGLERLRLRELSSASKEYGGQKLKPERLWELSDIIEGERDKFSWLLDDDVEIEDGWFTKNGSVWAPSKRNETETIKFLIDRLSGTELTIKDWKFSRMMRQSGLQFTERQMLKIVEGLGSRKHWRHAMSVVEWVYSSKELRHFKSRFVYTKLLAVLGRAGKPCEALRVFNFMRGDAYIYPDMATYHSLAVTLGQSGFLKELVNVIESMKEKPKKIRNVKHGSWDPVLQPDIVIFNAVLNACIPTRQWKGVSWVFEQLRSYGLRPNGASYGLAMEVMLQSEKYDLVHEFFERMKRSGEALKALTYKVLVKAFWKEGKVNEAVQAVRDMERRGIVGIASVYYELARCLCYYGRWKEAILEVEKLNTLHPTKPLAVAFSGIILSSMDGGHVHDCASIFDHCRAIVPPDIGIINAMLKVYGRNDMFSEARELFEVTQKQSMSGQSSSPEPDAFTFGSMLEAAANSLQWEYFDHVYKEMTLSGHQLDLAKGSSLLVEASRAGKWHILEHAFDTMLESGDVPPLAFFNEMVCQAVSRHDYGKAVNMIHAMAHAPWQVSFEQWIELFEMNETRIDQAALNRLHEMLVSRDLVEEATFLNLIRALQYKCGFCEGSVSMDMSTDLDEVSGLSSSRRGGDGSGVSTKLDERVDCELETEVLTCDSDEQEFERLEDEEEEILADGGGFNLEQFLPAADGADDSGSDDMPSASDILESWKQMKKKEVSGHADGV